MSTGKTYTKWEGTVYLRKHDSLEPFVWGGRCMRIEDIVSNEGGITITNRANPRGKLERDGTLESPPGEATSSLVMKRTQADTMKTELRTCLWDIDLRVHCGGIDRDAFNRWEEITRLCEAKVGARTVTGSAFSEDDEEMMVNADLTAFNVEDLYRVSGSEEASVASIDAQILDVAVAQPERCPDACDNQEECVIYAVTEGLTGSPSASPYLLINLLGGEENQWTAVSLAAIAGAAGVDCESVVGLGDFVLVSCNSESSVVYSDDQGTTQVEVAVGSAPAASQHALDAIDQTFIIVGCDNGDVYLSTDGARTWTQIADNLDSGNSMDIVKIVRDNPRVIFAASNSSDEVQKSENGGETWFTVATNVAAGASNITSLYPINQYHVLAGTDAGELFESVDGGVTWTEQTNLPGMTTKASVTINDITGCGCGVLYLVTFETAVGSRVYRNVDGGADGRWFVPDDAPDPTIATTTLRAVACCGANHAVAVGGQADTASSAVVLA